MTPESDWLHRANREAAAIVSEAVPLTDLYHYERLVRLVAIGWLQGVNFGTHQTLAEAERAFTRLQEDLTA